MQTQAYIIGKSAEHRVASELLLRGIVPFFPVIDSGVDLVTADGIRIQVKATNQTFSSGAASFTLCARKRCGKSGWRKFSDECDFLTLWHIPTNRFWIAPSVLFDGFTRCVVGTKTRKAKWTVETRRDALKLQSEGLSQVAIAKMLGQGLSRDNIKHLLHSENYVKRIGGRSKPGTTITLSEQVEQYENCWNLLRPDSFVTGESDAVPEKENSCAE